MKIKLFAVMLVLAMVLATVGVVAAAPADAKVFGTIAGDVTVISGNTLTVQTLAQGVVKVQTDANTRFRMKDKPQASLSDFKVGDRIVARGERTNDVLHAIVVVLVPANLHDLVVGKVQSISGSTIVVTTKAGSTVNIVTNGDTQFHTKDKATASLSDVKVGDVIAAAGVLTGDTLTAGQVRFNTPKHAAGPIALGKIESVNGSTLTLGSGLMVNLSGTTFIVKRSAGGATIGSTSDLVPGAGILVIGQRSGDGESMNAIVILIGRGDQKGQSPAGQQS